MNAQPCPFCGPSSERVIQESEHALALWDGYPVSPGHALIVPRRHVATWFDATSEEQADIFALVDRVRDTILAARQVDGWNIGVNVGEAAGQTVFHLHVHLIPRFAGDVEDPRGGVRWVVPGKADYWSARQDGEHQT